MFSACRRWVGVPRNFQNIRLMSESGSVVMSESGGVAWVTLNRPKALNALNLEMIRLLEPQLKQWAQPGKGIKLVVVRGAGGKAFCAGGDIRAITEVPGGPMQRDFFREEYQLDHLVGNYSLPYIALLNGITMGGGVGISVNGRWRIVTEKSLFAMPETSIGLLPDVGGGYFLPRLQGELGMFLGLTGHRLKGWDCLKAGVGTHAVKEEHIGKLDSAISSLASTSQDQDLHPHQIDSLLEEFTPEEARSHTFSLSPHLAMIDRVFSASTVEELVQRLENESGDALASKALNTIKTASPTSVKVAFRQLRRGRAMSSLGEVLKMEHRLVTRCCEDKDFYEGVRATLIDRDNKPVWAPPTLEEVTEERLDWYFSPLPQDRELLL